MAVAPPKKSVKMDLGSFLADDSLGGSWADEEVDMSSIGVPISGGSLNAPRRDDFFGRGSMAREGRDGTFGRDDRDGEMRRERKEFPVPDQPPYRARVGNLPWDISEAVLSRFFEDRMQMQDMIEEIKLPADAMTGKLKGFGFVTFTEKEVLEEALNLNLTELSGRKLFVNVAAPPKQDVFDMDWRAARSGPVDSGRPRREEVDLDWGSARSAGGLPPRERSGREERRPPRKEEPEIDWSSARSSTAVLPPRERSDRGERGPRVERRPKREEPELDWGSVRSQKASIPPPREPRSNSERKKRQERELDWKRGQTIEPRESSHRESSHRESSHRDSSHRESQSANKPKRSTQDDTKKEQPKPRKTMRDVLTVEDLDSDDDEENAEENIEEKDANKESEMPELAPSTSELEKATAKLTVDDDQSNEGWEVVGK